MKRTAAILLALLTMAGPAQAMTVSEKVGPLLKEAQALITDKTYNAAEDKLNEAEGVKSNPDDETVINQMRQFIAASKSSNPSQPYCTSARMGGTRCDGRAIQP
jgi:hypothetical protein